jgi:hypothetical protein
MNELLGQRMTEAVDLVVAVPAERDVPAGHLEVRKQALLQAIAGASPTEAAAAANGLRRRLRSIMGWLVSLVLLATLATLLLASPRAPKQQVVEFAAMTGAASAVSYISVAHRSPSAGAWRPAVLR